MSTENRTSWKYIVLRAFGYAWLAGSTVALLAGVIMAILDHDNPLASDDPYIVGFLFGAVAVALAALYSILERIPPLSSYKGLIYTICLSIWCLFFVSMDLIYPSSEAAGLGIFTAVGSLAAGIVAWALCRMRLPRWVILVISGGGVLFIVMFCIVCIRMASR